MKTQRVLLFLLLASALAALGYYLYQKKPKMWLEGPAPDCACEGIGQKCCYQMGIKNCYPDESCTSAPLQSLVPPGFCKNPNCYIDSNGDCCCWNRDVGWMCNPGPAQS